MAACVLANNWTLVSDKGWTTDQPKLAEMKVKQLFFTERDTFTSLIKSNSRCERLH